MRPCPSNVAIQRKPKAFCSSFSTCKRNCKNGVCAQLFLIMRAIQFYHDVIYFHLHGGIKPFQLRTDCVVDVCNCLLDTFAAVTIRVTVTELKRLIRTGGSPGRHGCTPYSTVGQHDLSFYRWISPGIQDFSCIYIYDGCHGTSSFPKLSFDYSRKIRCT